MNIGVDIIDTDGALEDGKYQFEPECKVAFLSSWVSGTTGDGDLGLMPWAFGISWMIGGALKSRPPR